MSVAGHHMTHVSLCQIKNGLLQSLNFCKNFNSTIAHVKFVIGRYLIVAATTGVNFLP